MKGWRALLRPYRAELVVALLLALITLLLAGGVVLRMYAFGIPTGCFALAPTIDCTDYALRMGEYGNALGTLAGPATAVTVAIPMLVAIVLGVALVARELEQQTTVFAWSMAPSRARWVLRRAGLVGAAVVAIGLLGGLLGDALVSVERPGLDPYRTFESFGLRGPVLPAAALLAFGLTVLVGAVFGRQLPTLLLAGVVLVPTLLGASVVHDAWLRTHAQLQVIEHPNDPYPLDDGARSLDSLLRTPDGDIVTWEEAYSRYGDAINTAGSEGSPFAIVIRYIPGAVYPLAVTVLTTLLAVIGLLAIGFTSLIVHRRRPYQ